VGLLTAVWLSIWPTPRSARADALSVIREPGAEDCPDARALEALVVALRKGQTLPANAAYRVQFASAGEQRSATVSGSRADPHAATRDANPAQAERVRVLKARGSSCEALAQATAVTLALLLDEQAEPAPEPARDEPRVAQREPSPSSQAKADGVLSLSLGGGGLLGVTRALAPLWLAELGFSRARFRVDLGALGVPVQRLSFAPGSLREWLVAGSLRGCYLPYSAPPFSIGTCAGAFVGAIDVRTRGYTRNARRRELWAALPIELFFAFERGPFALQLAAQALIPLRRPDFSIDGLGTAYASWPVSVALVVRVLGLWHGAFGPQQKK
jgi:hypothetical protein